jgi:cytochrome c553
MKRLLLAAILIAPSCAWAMPPVPDTMAERAKPCLACHEAEDRKSRDEYYPRLAGKPAGYLFNQMAHFRDGRRKHRAMGLLMENLSDAYLTELAGFFSNSPPVYKVAAKGAVRIDEKPVPALITQGDATRKIPACIACHGKEMLGVAPAIPGLLGLPADYVSAQFGAWKVGTRRAAAPECMAEIARQLTESEVSAMADWLATKPLPADSRPAASLSAELPMRCGSVVTTVKP